jgi:hypothetical protein
VRLHNAHCFAEDSLKAIFGLDKLIGGHHGNRCLRIHFRDDSATQTNGVQSVPTLGFAQKLASVKVFKFVEDEMTMPFAGTDDAPLRFDQAFKTLKGKLQQAFPFDKRHELLGKLGSAHGPQAGT